LRRIDRVDHRSSIDRVDPRRPNHLTSTKPLSVSAPNRSTDSSKPCMPIMVRLAWYVLRCGDSTKGSTTSSYGVFGSTCLNLHACTIYSIESDRDQAPVNDHHSNGPTRTHTHYILPAHPKTHTNTTDTTTTTNNNTTTTNRHDAGTFCAKDNTGGANGSIRFEPEISHGANAGLTWATQQLQVRRVGWEGSRWNGRRKRGRYAV
jgi:hypothetical protein